MVMQHKYLVHRMEKILFMGKKSIILEECCSL